MKTTMKTAARPQDDAAAAIEFGVEIETQIPVGSGVEVGGYHRGVAVTSGREAETGNLVMAPVLEGVAIVNAPCWRADRDGSIRCDQGFMPCEFVSPILRGEAGLENLIRMLAFIRRIGGRVNGSCGLHITVGVRSVIGSVETEKVAAYVRNLCHIAHQNAWAIYAQTGTGRHLNSYAHVLPPATEALLISMRHASAQDAAQFAEACGRGMVNLRKAFTANSAVEFRAFAGTLNTDKALHHLATTLGLVRRAAVMRTVGRFQKSSKKNRSRSAPEAVRRLWRILGWCNPTECQPIALGLFGRLHAEFGRYRNAAMSRAERFEREFPNANL
jgi:hypothetical protein